MERLLIEYCSATLAGLKTASMFSCSFISKLQLISCLREINKRLNTKDVFAVILRLKNKRALILVYRKSRLEEDLRNEEVKTFLTNYGYECGSVENCIKQLKMRFNVCKEFPHEIGVFLGYPLGDVVGFIKNSGKNCKCSGCWKVYGDDKEAKKLFKKYSKCKDMYMKLFLNGRSVMQLTVTLYTNLN